MLHDFEKKHYELIVNILSTLQFKLNELELANNVKEIVDIANSKLEGKKDE